jgi:hypothetical protein
MKQTSSQGFKPWARIASVFLVVGAFIGPVGSLSARSNKVENHLVISVTVYNYANVTPLDLQVAELRAAALFAEVNVRIAWMEYSSKLLCVRSRCDDSASNFSIRILNTSKIMRRQRISEVRELGESIIPQGTEGPLPGGIANVFYDRVRKFSSECSPFSGEGLGEVIAHELGHLLGARHSSQGIMKAPWTSWDLTMASRGKLQFLPAEVALLQSAVLSLHQDPSPMVFAQR